MNWTDLSLKQTRCFNFSDKGGYSVGAVSMARVAIFHVANFYRLLCTITRLQTIASYGKHLETLVYLFLHCTLSGAIVK